MTITKELIESIDQALDKGLTKGLGNPIEGEMCVEALICFKLGLPHSDTPSCVGKAVRIAKISLNDCSWSSNQARANGIRKLAIAQLGSDKLDQQEFIEKLRLASTKRILPFLIQKHFESTKDAGLLVYKAKFESLMETNDKLWSEFYNYYYNYNYYYYYHYYYNYYNYNYNYYSNYYYDPNNDTILILIADVILSVLIDMNCEGCKWLTNLDPKGQTAPAASGDKENKTEQNI